MFQQEDKADALIEQLLLNGEAVLRQGGVMVLGMAYAGTGNYAAIKRLLKFAVDDVSDDVRRSSTVSLALVLFRQYEQLPKYMKLLANSYNPHVRYGTAIALGLACAGTCYKEALELIEPLLDDTIEFV
jgi:26S proteasome regulatory subunit N2